MATVFWDSHGVILIDFLQKRKTITGAYYASLLDKLKVELVEKRRHFLKKKILFHQDNALSHTSEVAMVKIHELWFELHDHLPYLPDIAPCDFFLFPHLKTALGGQTFSSNKEAITIVNNYFVEKNADYYFDGLQRWAHLWENDEAHFWLNGYINKQNCRIWSEANPQVYVETPLHPEKLTVWCALWAGGILLQKR
ncbi:histone-lysine N-methyltransferase SETMAR [Trichonephila clavipes]|nr:histone-lysine N-methyltransferase SETMAR [Trichonephila clavipes]